MKKSIYVFGKVYDLEKELLEDIQNDVRARITEHTSIDIPCYINIDEANKQVDVMLIRGCSQNFDNNTILAVDAELLLGEPLFQGATFGFTIYNDIDDFKDGYKEIAKAQKASRIKSMAILETETLLKLTLCL